MSQNAFDAAMARHLQELLFHERPGKRTGSEYEERGTAGEWGGGRTRTRGLQTAAHEAILSIMKT